jgi:hypothetical protein
MLTRTTLSGSRPLQQEDSSFPYLRKHSNGNSLLFHNTSKYEQLKVQPVKCQGFYMLNLSTIFDTHVTRSESQSLHRACETIGLHPPHPRRNPLTRNWESEKARFSGPLWPTIPLWPAIRGPLRPAVARDQRASGPL